MSKVEISRSYFVFFASDLTLHSTDSTTGIIRSLGFGCSNCGTGVAM